MGLFGNDSSKTYSTTNLSQVDESVQVAGDAQNILGSGAHLALTSNLKSMTAGSGSFVVDATNTTLGDIIFNQFPEAVQDSIGDMLMSNDAVAKAIGESISQQQQFGIDLTKSIDATLTPPESDGKSLSPSIILGLIVAGGLALLMAKRLIKK